MPRTFWSQFEEPSIADEVSSEITKTSKREETDQRTTELAMATKTMTEVREEDDQDPKYSGFHAIPVVSTTGTMTQTRAREEADQDQANAILVSHGSSAGANTHTATAQREERDQDRGSVGYAAIPCPDIPL